MKFIDNDLPLKRIFGKTYKTLDMLSVTRRMKNGIIFSLDPLWSKIDEFVDFIRNNKMPKINLRWHKRL